jgi:hypothetical protein
MLLAHWQPINSVAKIRTIAYSGMLRKANLIYYRSVLYAIVIPQR